MKPFRVFLTREAQADIFRLDSKIQTRILNRLEWIGKNADLIRHEALKGDEWRGCFKYRVGDYRIVYQWISSEKIVTVLKVRHRREVYK